MLTRIAAMIVVAVTCSELVADHHETSTREEFQEFGKLMEGRWVVDVKLIADWPGMKEKRGESITGYSQVKWIVDGHALEEVHVAGTGVFKTWWAWDSTTKKIKAFSVTNGGMVNEFVVWKKSDGVFGWRAIAGGITGVGVHEFSKDRKTMKLLGSDLKLNGEETDDLKDIYSKVSPSE